MADASTKHEDVGAVSDKIQLDRATLERLRADALNVKRMGRQAATSADNLLGEFDKLIRQATDSKAS